MHKLQRDFSDFHRRLTLNASQKTRAKQAWNGIRTVLKGNRLLGDRTEEVFVQGSYAHDTLVKPKYVGQEFDLDVVVVLNCDDSWGNRMAPREILTLLAQQLRSHHNYKGKVGQRERCVRVNFAGEFHMDVVPCHPVSSWLNGQALEVPDKTSQRWQNTDPAGLAAWYTRRNRELDGRFKRCAKYFREWKREQYVKRGPPSLVLDVLLGELGRPGHGSDAAFFADALAEIYAHLSGRYTKPRIENPSLPSEDLSRNWDDATFRGFVGHVGRAAEVARRAVQTADQDDARRLWGRLLGERFAP